MCQLTKSVRTHRLFQSTQILETFHKYDLENDSSLPKLNPNDAPYYLKSAKLYRFPYFWEDYKNMVEDKIWSLPESLFEEDELKIFNFSKIFFLFHVSKFRNPFCKLGKRLEP